MIFHLLTDKTQKFWYILNYRTHKCLSNKTQILLPLILGKGFQMDRNDSACGKGKKEGGGEGERETNRAIERESLPKEIESWTLHIGFKIRPMFQNNQ